MTRTVDHLHLLGSAIAGRPVDVAADDEVSWTDGATIFVGPGVPVTQAVAVQASLLAAGSLTPEALSDLGRHPERIPGWLAVEGRRALTTTAGRLPPAALALIHGEGRSDVFGTVRPKQVRTAEELAPATHTPRSLAELDDGEEPPGLDVSWLTSPVGGGGPVGRLLKKLLRDSASGGSGGPPGGDAPTRASRGRRPGGTAVSGPGALLGDGDDPGLRGTTYPEWDLHRHAYRPDWCTVREVPVTDAGREPVDPPDPGALVRPLTRLAIDLEPHRRQHQGDDLDLDAMVAAVVELREGREPAAYVSSRRTRRDLAVQVLLDVSGSAGEPSSSGSTVHAHQVQVTAALVSGLARLGDRVGVQAFRSQGRSAVQVSTVLRLGGRWDATALHRLGQLEPGAYTRLGAAVRHATSTLDGRGGCRRRLLVVVSDGFAYDHGYEAAYGEADARRALTEARRRGIGCVCLTVGAGTDPVALRRVFGPAAQASIAHPDALPQVVGPLFRTALRSADATRRRRTA